MGEGRRLRHGDFAGDQQIEASEGLLVGRRVRVGAERVRWRRSRRAGARGGRRNLLGHHVGGKTPMRAGKPVATVRQVLGWRSSVCAPMGMSWPGSTLPPGTQMRPQTASRTSEVRGRRAVAVHKIPQVRVQARPARGKQAAHLPDLLVVQLADAQRSLSVKAREPGLDLGKAADVLREIVRGSASLPAE